ncbi:MBL fold metallo-hydrolase [Patescibacteria group bacterium]|nr:MBL fold metallo-hydrolase [Patescibacteria group bacterium]MCL5409701.1 MBL fold metallo-hydrolase [Patescibacteria group bacterium]
MDITWLGQACFKIKGKNATVVIDPFDPGMMGLKLPKDLEADVVLSTHDHPDHNYFAALAGEPLIIKGPGEYEVKGITIEGIASFHDNSSGQSRGVNTIYHFTQDKIDVVHLGDLGHLLTDEQISEIENTDILLIPVGGNYTIDGERAAKVVAQLEPKIVIPMHYKLPEMKLEIEGVESFLKEMGTENIEPANKLTITAEKLPDETTVVLLSKV